MQKGRDNKPHIGIYGRRNNGKSSLINNLTGQDIAIVSEIAGTTTDPVKKSLEILGFGPVILIDTAGIDDFGELGEKRISKTLESIKIIDLAILLITNNEFGNYEKDLIKEFNNLDTPFIVVHNKSDVCKLSSELKNYIETEYKSDIIEFSSLNSSNFDTLVDLIKNTIPDSAYTNPSLVGDLVTPGDFVLLITPIDTEAPEGRMILPQVQAIRDVLDNNCIAVVLKESEVQTFFDKINIKPSLAITDSQMFKRVNVTVPKDVPLTGFSIVLARMKGDFENYIKGTPKISELKDGDRILLLESCTHHVSCDDIGRNKIPHWLTEFTGKKLDFDVVAGLSSITRKITDYSLVIQCGGCMITRKQIINRLKPAVKAGVPVTNYGMAIAYLHGVYNRAIEPFTKK